MRKTYLFILYFCALLFYLYNSTTNLQAEISYTKIPFSTVSNLVISNDYVNFPTGDVSFSGIPFWISDVGNNFLATQNLACVSCPTSVTFPDLNVRNPNLVFILVNSSDSFIQYVGQNYAYIRFYFNNSEHYDYDFIVGDNVREWLQSGKYGSTVNSVTSNDSTEVWRGMRPNGEVPVVTDLLKINIPDQYNNMTMTKIEIVDDSVHRVSVGNSIEPGIVIKGITIRTNATTSQISISPTSNWSTSLDQLPVDREAEVRVKVMENGVVSGGVTVRGEVVSGGGLMDRSESVTDENGEAVFEFTPESVGDVRLSFGYGGESKEYILHVYRPPVLIIPGHGASFNGNEILLGQPSVDWHWFTEVSLNGWDELIETLESNGYIENLDYAIAFYDWRKGLQGARSVDARDRFVGPAIDRLLSTRPAGQKVAILSHSFGGLVARTMIERSNYRSKIERLMTMGTPHRGSVNAYYSWEGGVAAPIGDAFYRTSVFALNHLVAQNLGLANPAQALRNTIPSVQELMPVFSPYLYRGGEDITNQITVGKNPLLERVLSIETFLVRLSEQNIAYDNVISGNQNTIGTITVEDVETIGQWEDGKPTGRIGETLGDGTVDAAQMQLSDRFDTYVIAQHSDMPDAARTLVRERLKLQPATAQGKSMPTKMFMLLVLSPAYAEIVDQQNVVISKVFDLGDGQHQLVYISDFEPGIYKVKVTGTGEGNFELFGNYADGTHYQEITKLGVTKKDQVDTYRLLMDNGVGDAPLEQQTIETTFKWSPGKFQIRRGIAYSTIELTLPNGLQSSELNWQQLRINDKSLQIISSKVNKKGKLATIELRTTDLLQAVKWQIGLQPVTLQMESERYLLKATGSFVIPSSVWKRFTL